MNIWNCNFFFNLFSWCAYRSQLQDFDYLKKLSEDAENAKNQHQQSFAATSEDWGCGAAEWSVDGSQIDYDEISYINDADTQHSLTSLSSSLSRSNNAASLEECMDNLDISTSSDSDLSQIEQNKVLFNESANEAFRLWKKTINGGLTRSPTISFDTNKPYFQGNEKRASKIRMHSHIYRNRRWKLSRGHAHTNWWFV